MKRVTDGLCIIYKNQDAFASHVMKCVWGSGMPICLIMNVFNMEENCGGLNVRFSECRFYISIRNG